MKRWLPIMVSMVAMARLAAAGSDDAYLQKLDALNRAVASGDAWNVGIPAAVKVLGQPAVVTPKKITWASIQGPYCLQVYATLDENGFIEALIPAPYGAAAPPKDTAACKALTKKHAKIGALPAPRAVNIDAQVNTVLAQWREGKLQAMRDAAHSDLQNEVPLSTFEALSKVFAKNAGKLVKIGKPTYSVGNYGWIATVPLTYEKHAAQVVLVFRLVDNKPKLYAFNQSIEDDVPADKLVQDAPKPARKILDLLLAGKLADIEPMMHWELAKSFRANKAFPAKLKALVAKYGKMTEIFYSGVDQRGIKYQVTFDLTGANGKGQAVIELTRMVGDWLMSDFVITPPK